MDKVLLRVNNLPENNPIKVLDCFGGEGKIWDKVRLMTKRKIHVLPIDKNAYEGKVYLKGENIKYLKTLDLEKYDVIDLDAYGMPYKQLGIIFDRLKPTKTTTIFVTFIQVNVGSLQNDFLVELGYTKQMVKKVPTLFARKGFEKFKNYLAKKGIKNIKHRSLDRKHYIYFNINHRTSAVKQSTITA